MKRLAAFLLTTAVITFPFAGFAKEPVSETANPQVRMTTSQGVIELELDAKRAPVTVKNFLGYVKSGFYNGRIFRWLEVMLLSQ